MYNVYRTDADGSSKRYLKADGDWALLKSNAYDFIDETGAMLVKKAMDTLMALLRSGVEYPYVFGIEPA